MLPIQAANQMHGLPLEHAHQGDGPAILGRYTELPPTPQQQIVPIAFRKGGQILPHRMEIPVQKVTLPFRRAMEQSARRGDPVFPSAQLFSCTLS